MHYLNQIEVQGSGYIESTRKELQEKIGIPIRSLDRLLKDLKKENKVFYRSKRGKGGGILLMSVRSFLKQYLQRKREKQEVYLSRLKQLFSLTNEELETIIVPFLEKYRRSEQLNLFEADTG